MDLALRSNPLARQEPTKLPNMDVFGCREFKKLVQTSWLEPGPSSKEWIERVQIEIQWQLVISSRGRVRYLRGTRKQHDHQCM